MEYLKVYPSKDKTETNGERGLKERFPLFEAFMLTIINGN